MAFAIARIVKLKGGSVKASAQHNDRTRETPNADPERREENRILIGDDSPVHERVTQVIEEHGGKPRSDSVECVEILLTASPEFFLDENGEMAPDRVESFVERATRFLKEEAVVGRCIKAVLHADERTPHVQAHCVPIDPKGKLNCKHFFGGRVKLSAFQDAFHERVKDLGLDRGIKGSRATHIEIKRFYGTITEEHKIVLNHDRLPDPPRVFLTKEGVKKYKDEIIKSVNEQVKEPLRVLHHQAMLARDERAKRLEAEKRWEEKLTAVERTAGQRVSEANTRAEQAELREQDTVKAYHRQSLVSEGLLVEKEALQKVAVRARVGAMAAEEVTKKLNSRLMDIPMSEVMTHLGYDGESGAAGTVYRDQKNQVAMVVVNGKAYNSKGEVLFRNSIELVARVRGTGQGDEAVKAEALTWLAEQFGPGRATAAYVIEREQAAIDILDERMRVKGEQEREKSNERVSASVREATRVQEPVSREHTRDRDDSFVHER
jgi:hypothetical protein